MVLAQNLKISRNYLLPVAPWQLQIQESCLKILNITLIRPVQIIFHHRACAGLPSEITPQLHAPSLEQQSLQMFFLQTAKKCKSTMLVNQNKSDTKSFFGFSSFSFKAHFLGFQISWFLTPQNTYFLAVFVVLLGFQSLFNFTSGYCD